MDRSEELAGSKRAYLIAPAGTGKTHLIAEAVAKHGLGRQLILTHTHAGVDALRQMLRKLGAPVSKFQVSTIAGWALQYAASFPKTSGLETVTPAKADWLQVYGAACKLLDHPRIHEVVRASYGGVYVDEYQDCTVEQHKLILSLANIIPCRILGDPLQGIFGFKNNVLVNWDTDVSPNFVQLADLSTPWRWIEKSPDLGRWLMTVRTSIQNGVPIDLRKAPHLSVKWIQLPLSKQGKLIAQIGACRSVPKTAEDVVAIHQWERQCNQATNILAPMYCNIETIECDDLMKSATDIETGVAIDRVEAVVDFASQCVTGVRQALQTALSRLRQERMTARTPCKREAELKLLRQVLSEQDLTPVLPALEAIRRMPGVKLWRRELFYAMCQSLREFATGRHKTLKDAAWAVRNRTRQAGRPIGRRAIGRTLLVKGLEFDHCLLLDADALMSKDLYVALTRATRSLTILSQSPIINIGQQTASLPIVLAQPSQINVD